MKYCTNCGAKIKENAEFCTNCGKSIKNQNSSRKETNGFEKSNKMAVTGFVLAMVSLIINFSGLVGLLAIIFSSIGISQTSKNEEKGKGLAIAGLLVGIFSLIYGIVITLLKFVY